MSPAWADNRKGQKMNLVNEWWALVRREFTHYRADVFRKDLLAALTVAAVALPLALAFGVASGADAAAGLVTAVLAGVVIGFLGGAPYQISGPTGAMSAVLIVLASRHGVQGVWLAGIMAGIMMAVLGLLRMGRVVALIPAPVIAGFTSGIAVIIALGQIDNALGIATPSADSVVKKTAGYFGTGISPNYHALGLTVLVIALMLIWPRFKISRQIPGSLAAIIAASMVVAVGHWQVPVIGTIPRTILLENRLHLADVPWADLGELLVPAMSVAALGAIESLLCGAVGGNMTGVRLHNSVELVAQGIGNVVIPFFGGVPATAAIARTSVNVKSGGVTRMVPIAHGIILAAVALLLAPIIGRVPLASLAGVLMVTAWRMNEWHAIRFFFGKRLKHAVIAFVVTLAATVLLDLTQAILIGFGISTLIFMSQISDLHLVRQEVDEKRLVKNGRPFAHPDHPLSVYYLGGPLFFAAARKLLEEVERQDVPGAKLILSMRGVPLIDATGIEVLREIKDRQRRAAGDLLLSGLHIRVETLLHRSGFLDDLGTDRVFWSADQAILSLGGVPAEPSAEPEPEEAMEDTLALLPYEDLADREL